MATPSAVLRKKGGWKRGSMKGKGGPLNATCSYRGVRQRTWGKWVAEIREPAQKRRKWLGSYPTALEAALAYDRAARTLYGATAHINVPDYNPDDAMEGSPAGSPSSMSGGGSADVVSYNSQGPMSQQGGSTMADSYHRIQQGPMQSARSDRTPAATSEVDMEYMWSLYQSMSTAKMEQDLQFRPAPAECAPRANMRDVLQQDQSQDTLLSSSTATTSEAGDNHSADDDWHSQLLFIKRELDILDDESDGCSVPSLDTSHYPRVAASNGISSSSGIQSEEDSYFPNGLGVLDGWRTPDCDDASILSVL